MIQIDQLEKALSLERFGRYVGWAGGDRNRAAELYAFNTRLSEALYTPLQMLEVALRNRIHAVMSDIRNSRWFEDEGFLLVMDQKAKLGDALRRLKSPTPGQVVAALSFGFWTSMFDRPYDELWKTALYRIAAREDGRHLARKDFSRPLAQIQALRNRIAHHEPILKWDLPKHHETMLRLTGWLSPTAAEWCRSIDRFDSVYPIGGIALLVIT